MGKGILAQIRERIIASTPEVDLDAPGYVVQRTAEGLEVVVDPVAFRRSARRAGILVAVFFGGLAFIPLLPLRIFAVTVAVLVLVLGFVAKPRPDRVLVAPGGAKAAVRGRPARAASASEIDAVRLRREEHEVHDENGSHRRVVWSVWLDVAAGPWFLASSGDGAKARTFAEDAAIALGRPFVDASAGGDVVVPADAVNLPFVERARRGVVVTEDPGPPPPGVERRATPSGVEFVAARRSWKGAAALWFMGAWFTLLGFGGTALLAAAAFDADGSAWALAFAVFPLLFGVAGVIMIIGGFRMITGESYVRVERDGLVHGVRRGRRDSAKRAPFSDFEDVQGVRGVRLVSDDGDRGLGFDVLPAPAQEWVAAALRRELARRG